MAAATVRIDPQGTDNLDSTYVVLIVVAGAVLVGRQLVRVLVGR